MKTLYLYTTLGCHLCEQAKALSWPVLEHYGYRLQEVEIADDDDLMACYGVRIPVVRREGLEQDLGWPFSQEELALYLSAGND
ncbi:glutaredoxin family protein [Aestuariicella hydrocarbonica]|uniref:Glutaredoxin family protein n=1 Tax=Pseudomaricurvus hydrocarbonicus TaxID=1470433 RepID=A0A9E5K0N6_9GAMM|nr:glutaredoxin family protein [Aestuariicella hydrocarbonica]NHO66467.1 glutaredoxin family protein [Aestuariicella hydrocarbonica]